MPISEITKVRGLSFTNYYDGFSSDNPNNPKAKNREITRKEVEPKTSSGVFRTIYLTTASEQGIAIKIK